jgi:hypothetical protein
MEGIKIETNLYSVNVKGWDYLEDQVQMWGNTKMDLYTVFTDRQERNCHKDINFNTSCTKGELILLSLCSDTWLVSGKSCSAWRWVMQFLPGAGKWQLRSGLSVIAVYFEGVEWFKLVQDRFRDGRPQRKEKSWVWDNSIKINRKTETNFITMRTIF